MIRLFLALLALLAPAIAAAAPLTVTKSMTIVSDGVNAANFKAVPGALVDYTISVQNPLLNGQASIVVICDTLPPGLVMRMDDLVAGKGPIVFSDGILGLLTTGLAPNYLALTAATDGLTFYDSLNANLVPATGFDPRVRRFCVALSGRMVAGSGFSLRFRVRVA